MKSVEQFPPAKYQLDLILKEAKQKGIQERQDKKNAELRKISDVEKCVFEAFLSHIHNKFISSLENEVPAIAAKLSFNGEKIYIDITFPTSDFDNILTRIFTQFYSPMEQPYGCGNRISPIYVFLERNDSSRKYVKCECYSSQYHVNFSPKYETIFYGIDLIKLRHSLQEISDRMYKNVFYVNLTDDHNGLKISFLDRSDIMKQKRKLLYSKIIFLSLIIVFVIYIFTKIYTS